MVICYTLQRQHARGVDYRNPRWFSAPMSRAGDTVVVVGNWPAVVSAYQSAGVPVTVQSDPYLGEPVPAPSVQMDTWSPPTPPVMHRDADAGRLSKSTDVPDRPLISYTKAELQAEAGRRGVPYKAAASRSELLTLLGAR